VISITVLVQLVFRNGFHDLVLAAHIERMAGPTDNRFAVLPPAVAEAIEVAERSDISRLKTVQAMSLYRIFQLLKRF